MISNNSAEFGIRILKHAIGENYRDFFDFLIFDANKPDFMYSEETINLTCFQTRNEIDFDQIPENKILQYGDMVTLNEYCIRKHHKNFRGIIFEDNFYCGFEK